LRETGWLQRQLHHGDGREPTREKLTHNLPFAQGRLAMQQTFGRRMLSALFKRAISALQRVAQL